jgi:DNA-binding winged helix-turn-helix (wHTH) protein
MEAEIRRSKPVVRFGVFEVDLKSGEVRKDGLKVKLAEQPFQVLVALLEHPGEVVTREELQQKLWSNDTFVDFDNSLNKAIKKIREALGDSADNPRFVQTLARRGYRFIAPVEAPTLKGEARQSLDPPSTDSAIKAVQFAGQRNLSLDDSFGNLSMEDLIKLHNHGVNAEFLREIRQEGYDAVTLDELIRLRNHGVDAEFIRRLKVQGMPKLSIDQLIKMRSSGF